MTLPVKKAELASQLGLTAAHFSRILQELRSAGVLRVERRQLTLLDRPALARLAARR